MIGFDVRKKTKCIKPASIVVVPKSTKTSSMENGLFIRWVNMDGQKARFTLAWATNNVLPCCNPDNLKRKENRLVSPTQMPPKVQPDKLEGLES